MFLGRLLAINMAALGALGAMLLGMGERSAALPLAVLVSAAVSVWITDIQGWFRLNRTAVNLLALLAALVCLWDVLRLRGALSALWGVADLLLYLQILLMFQKKTPRLHWQLAAISLLEVVIAAVFSQGAFFGLALGVYMYTAVSALALFYLQRQWDQFQRVDGAAPSAGPPGRWPLAGQAASVARSTLRSGARSGFGRDLIGRLALITVSSLILALGIFTVFPRLGKGAWRGQGSPARATVGFDSKVTLGELGRIIENPQEVLRLQLFDAAAREPYAVPGEVHLRGAILTDYEGGQWESRWSQVQMLGADIGHRVPPTPADVVLERITIEPMDRDELFAVWPYFMAPEAQPVAFDAQFQRLHRDANRSAERLTYELLTTAFRGGRQTELVPSRLLGAPHRLLQMPPREGPHALPRLIALAGAWAAECKLPADDRYGRARHLGDQFRRSGRFGYSLEGQARDPAMDPIEDFVSQHPVGHCEYFATALVLMLRSQGIPARMIVGYRTEEYNGVGKYFQVRQLHAHTWVEAYLEPRHIPAASRHPEYPGQFRFGAWLRLDPTPGGELTAANAAPANPIARARQWIDNTWSNYVMEMDRPRQHEAVYQPLLAWVRRTGENVADPSWWAMVGQQLLQLLDPRHWNWNWISWRGGLTTIAIGFVLVGLYQALALAGRRVRDAWRERRDQRWRRAQVRVLFYRRFESLLARHGLVRGAAQTQEEFARAAAARVPGADGDSALAESTLRIARAFYRVRFGRQALPERELAQIDRQLAELDRALRAGRRGSAVGSRGG